MAGLQAEELNSEFLKNFIPETIFLTDEDKAMPEPARQRAQTPVPATPVNEKTETSATTVPTPPVAASPVTPSKYKIIGNNRKGIAVLVTLPDNEFMALPGLEFLQKILSAIGLMPEDVAYVNNLSGANAIFEDLQQALEVKYILSFASRVDSSLPHDKFTLYNPVKLGSVPIVFSHALADLAHDQEKKKLLWGALQRTFLN